MSIFSSPTFKKFSWISFRMESPNAPFNFRSALSDLSESLGKDGKHFIDLERLEFKIDGAVRTYYRNASPTIGEAYLHLQTKRLGEDDDLAAYTDAKVYRVMH